MGGTEPKLISLTVAEVVIFFIGRRNFGNQQGDVRCPDELQQNAGEDPCVL